MSVCDIPLSLFSVKQGYFVTQLAQLIRKQGSFVCNKQLFIVLVYKSQQDAHVTEFI